MSLSRRIPAALSPFLNRVIGACLLGGLLAAGAPAQAEEATGNARWVSDSLTTFVRSGPTDGYRIVGTLTSGQKVELLGTQGNYSQELSGSTITLSSLGALGGIVSTPVINHPEVAIVGVNRIVERPMVVGGNIVVRKMMNLSSSFDHRVVDGMDAAAFIQAVRGLLEHPATLFLE